MDLIGQSRIQECLDKALTLAGDLNLVPRVHEESELAGLLNDLVSVDEASVLALAKVIQYKSTFALLVAENIKGVEVFQRYGQIAELLDSIPQELETRKAQLTDDQKITWDEKLRNWYVDITDGNIQDRFSKTHKLYRAVTKDAKKQIELETKVIDAYFSYRMALGDGTVIAKELVKTQHTILEAQRSSLETAEQAVKGYQGDKDSAEYQALIVARDRVLGSFHNEEKRYHLTLFIAQDMSTSYSAMEIVVANINQDQQAKQGTFNRAISLFENNADVRAAFAVAYTVMLGTHELAQTVNVLGAQQDKLLEKLVEQSGQVNREAIEATFGPHYKPETMEKAAQALVTYARESRQLISELIEKSQRVTAQIEESVERSKQEVHAEIIKYTLNPTPT